MMNAYEFNKVAGGVLFAVFVVLGLRIVGDMIYGSPTAGAHTDAALAQPATVETTPDSGAQVAAIDVASLADRLVGADLARGTKTFKKCKACHAAEKGGKNKVGPVLWGIVGRTFGTVDGFKYSKVFTKAASEGRVWTYDEIDQYITAPRKYLKGTKMTFAGLRKPKDRANLLLYLRSLSDTPAPLPHE